MGQKVHPTGIRLGISTDWNSKWYASKTEFSKYLLEDVKIRDYLKKKLAHASVSKIVIERPAKEAVVTIFTARPGIVIGKKGEDIEVLRKEVAKILDLKLNNIKMERAMRFELTTSTLARLRSTPELRPHKNSTPVPTPPGEGPTGTLISDPYAEVHGDFSLFHPQHKS